MLQVLTQCQNKGRTCIALKKNIGSLLALDVYPTQSFERFICTIDATYVEAEHLNDAGKPNYNSLKPVLFQLPTYEYLKTGEVIGKCLSFKSK